MIYVSRGPTQEFVGKWRTPLAVGSTHGFPSDHYEKLQRIFLHKPVCRAYEELKCLSGLSANFGSTPSGEFTVLKKEDRVLHLLSLPPRAIKELYFGLHSDTKASDDLFYEAKELQFASPHFSGSKAW